MLQNKPEPKPVEYADFEVIGEAFGFHDKGVMTYHKKGTVVTLPRAHGKSFPKFLKLVKKEKN